MLKALTAQRPIHTKKSSAAQQQGCKFLEVSLTLKMQLICQGGRGFCQVRRLVGQVGTFICQGGQNTVEKRRVIFSCVRGLIVGGRA